MPKHQKSQWKGADLSAADDISSKRKREHEAEGAELRVCVCVCTT